MDLVGTASVLEERLDVEGSSFQKSILEYCTETLSEAASDGRDQVKEAQLKESAIIANRLEVKEAQGDEKKLCEAADKLTKANLEAEMFFIN